MKQPLSCRVFALLLHAYPASYRTRFGRSMVADFHDRLSEMEGTSLPKRIAFWTITIFDVIRLAPAEHLRARSTRRRMARSPRSWRAREGLVAWISSLRITLRMIVKNPLSSTIAVASIAFGIGLSVTTFSIVYGSTIRGLPFENAKELVHFERQNLARGLSGMAVTPHDYIAWKEQQKSFEGLAAFVEASILIRDETNTPRPEVGVRIDRGAFDLLRVKPAIGRVFSQDENLAGAPKVILLSHGLWQGRFGGDSSIVGRSIRVTDQTTEMHTVIGIMPEGFGFPILERFWLPLRLDLHEIERGAGRLDVFGRLAPTQTIDAARREFAVITSRLAAAYPETNAGVEAKLATFQEEFVGDAFASRVRLMLAGSLFVLLIACANVSNLLVVRAVRRTKEIAIRSALGASRRSVATLIMAESTIIALVGGTMGVALSIVGVDRVGDALLQAGAVSLPHGAHPVFWWRFDVDFIPLTFAFAMIVASAVMAGLIPVVLAARTDVNALLKEEQRGSGSPRLRRLGEALVSLEVALAVGLLMATALSVKSLMHLRSLDVGFPDDRIIVASVGLFGEAYENDGSRRAEYWHSLLRDVEALPGVTAAALSSRVPMLIHGPIEIGIPGRDRRNGAPVYARHVVVTPGFFETFQLEPVAGRLFTDLESRSDASVVVVNESFVNRFFGGENSSGAGQDPVGASIHLGTDGGSKQVTIVGVVPDSWMDGERNVETQGVFSALDTQAPLRLFLSFQTATPAADISNQLADVASGIDPEQPIFRVRTMRNLIEERTGRYQIHGTFYVIFGVTALVMAVMGLYGVISFTVGQRTNEIGIRVALGADRSNVVRSVLGHGARQVGIGLALGTTLAVWISRGLDSVLFGVEEWDSMAFVAVLIVLLMTSLLACMIPARRAARVSPLIALRDG